MMAKTSCPGGTNKKKWDLSCGRKAKKENKNGLVRDISKENRHYIVVTRNRKKYTGFEKESIVTEEKKKRKEIAPIKKLQIEII